jgi:1-acyl-sn-glycerol-3-phosphate acyltransferase
MIKKIVAFIVLFILVISISQTICLGSYLFGKKEEGANIAKDIIISFIPYIYTYGFESKILYNGNYNASNKVDIVISNHINTIDFTIYLSLIRLFDSRPIYFLFKKSIVFIPGSGFILGSGYDVKMNRKMEDDEENINNSISKIKEGIIILMPEGTRFTPDKYVEAQKYSKDNNLPVFKNTLFPKMKGVYTISNILKKNGVLGNIIDFTIQIENFKNTKCYMDKIMTKNLGNTFSIINTYSIPEKVLNSYDTFKKWFLIKIWMKKDIILETIQDTKLNEYKELVPNMKGYEYFIIIICVTLFFYFATHTNGLSIPISLLITYSMMYVLYRKSKKIDNENFEKNMIEDFIKNTMNKFNE